MPKSKTPPPDDIDSDIDTDIDTDINDDNDNDNDNSDDDVLAEFETRQQMEPDSERWHSLDKDDPSDELEEFDPAPPAGR